MKFFFSSFFSKVQKVKYLHIYKAMIVKISVNLSMVNIYNFDPTTWRTSRTTSRWWWTQKVRATQNFIKRRNNWKDQYNMGHFWKKCNKVKNEVAWSKKRCFGLIYLITFWKIYLFGSCYFILTFLQFSQNIPDYIDPSDNFVFYEIV